MVCHGIFPVAVFMEHCITFIHMTVPGILQCGQKRIFRIRVFGKDGARNIADLFQLPRVLGMQKKKAPDCAKNDGTQGDKQNKYIIFSNIKR